MMTTTIKKIKKNAIFYIKGSLKDSGIYFFLILMLISSQKAYDNFLRKKIFFVNLLKKA